MPMLRCSSFHVAAGRRRVPRFARAVRPLAAGARLVLPHQRVASAVAGCPSCGGQRTAGATRTDPQRMLLQHWRGPSVRWRPAHRRSRASSRRPAGSRVAGRIPLPRPPRLERLRRAVRPAAASAAKGQLQRSRKSALPALAGGIRPLAAGAPIVTSKTSLADGVAHRAGASCIDFPAHPRHAARVQTQPAVAWLSSSVNRKRPRRGHACSPPDGRKYRPAQPRVASDSQKLRFCLPLNANVMPRLASCQWQFYSRRSWHRARARTHAVQSETAPPARVRGAGVRARARGNAVQSEALAPRAFTALSSWSASTVPVGGRRVSATPPPERMATTPPRSGLAGRLAFCHACLTLAPCLRRWRWHNPALQRTAFGSR